MNWQFEIILRPFQGKIAEKELAQISTGADGAQGARGRVETAGD